MAGTAENAHQFDRADVAINFDRTSFAYLTSVTADLEAAGYDFVGLLDGDEGFTQARDSDTSEKYAWGGSLIRTKTSKFKRTVKFVVLEDNATVFGLVNPGSTSTTTAGVTTRDIKTPISKEFSIIFRMNDEQTGETVIRQTSRAAVTEIGDIKDSETDVTVYEITVVLYPDENDVIYRELIG